jgi:hypothetical protein
LIRVLPPPYCPCIDPCDILHFGHLKGKREEKSFLPGKEASFSLYGHFGGNFNKYCRERDNYLSSQVKEMH